MDWYVLENWTFASEAPTSRSKILGRMNNHKMLRKENKEEEEKPIKEENKIDVNTYKYTREFFQNKMYKPK